MLLYNLGVINQSQHRASITGSLQAAGKTSRAHTTCLYPNAKEELNTDSVCIHSDPGTRQVSACITKGKHRRYCETSSYGSYLPCYFPSEHVTAINALRACQSKAEYPIRALIFPLFETSAPQKRAQDTAAVLCHPWSSASLA